MSIVNWLSYGKEQISKLFYGTLIYQNRNRIHGSAPLGRRSVFGLVRAVKVSCISDPHFPAMMLLGEQEEARLVKFTSLLRSRWFRVLITLLSVRIAPRLGKSSPLRSVPRELIQKATNTLGWEFPDTSFLNQTEFPEDAEWVIRWIDGGMYEQNYIYSFSSSWGIATRTEYLPRFAILGLVSGSNLTSVG